MADHITDKAVTAAARDEFRRTWSVRLDALLSRADLLDPDDQLAVLTVHETLLAEQFAALPVLNTTKDAIERLRSAVAELHVHEFLNEHFREVNADDPGAVFGRCDACGNVELGLWCPTMQAVRADAASLRGEQG